MSPRTTNLPAGTSPAGLAVGMDLIRQIGAGDVLHRPVAPPHLARKIGPAPRHQIPAREPQPTRPARAVAGVPLAPDPGQLPYDASALISSGRVAVTRCARPCMSCTSAAVTSSKFVIVRHCARTPQSRPTVFRGHRSRQSTAQRAKRIVMAAEPMPGRAAMSLDDAGRLRTSTHARHDLQGGRCLLRH